MPEETPREYLHRLVGAQRGVVQGIRSKISVLQQEYRRELFQYVRLLDAWNHQVGQRWLDEQLRRDVRKSQLESTLASEKKKK